MDEHVNFNPTKSVVEFSDELVPVFVQDREDYPSNDFDGPSPKEVQDETDQDVLYFYDDIDITDED